MSAKPEHAGPQVQSPQPDNLSNFGGERAANPPLFQLKSEGGQGIVQRAGPLTAAQVTTALAFYSGRSADFSAGIIKEIQGKVGVTASGTMDAATAQGVATFQKNAGMPVNGTLDSLTIPQFFPHGLAIGKAQEDYTTAFRGIQWATLKTPQAKAKALVDAVNVQLKAAGVPEIGVTLGGGLGTASGHFHFATWAMKLDQGLFALPNIPQAKLDKMANYVIHESRHAEQWFNMAQLLAGQGKTAAQIATKMGIPKRIATLAAASPIQKDSSKALVVKGWYESVYGANAAARNTTITNVTTTNNAANYAAYKALPEESDAFQIGDGFNKELKKQRTP